MKARRVGLGLLCSWPVAVDSVTHGCAHQCPWRAEGVPPSEEVCSLKLDGTDFVEYIPVKLRCCENENTSWTSKHSTGEKLQGFHICSQSSRFGVFFGFLGTLPSHHRGPTRGLEVNGCLNHRAARAIVCH